MPNDEQRTPTVRLIIPVNHILNDDDDASVELTRHSVHHQHAVTLMVTIVGEPRTVWLDTYDLQRLELAVTAARRWLDDPASHQAATAAAPLHDPALNRVDNAGPHDNVVDESLPGHDGSALTAEQLDGLHCIHCNQPGAKMRPVAQGPRGQLFAHRSCNHRGSSLR